MIRKYSKLKRIALEKTPREIWEEDHGEIWDEEEYGEFPERDLTELNRYLSDLVKVAQKRYDAWELDEQGYNWEVDVGGICHLIADDFVDVLSQNGFITGTVSSNFEQHVFTVVNLIDGVYSIDIPHSLYETGGGFSWEKIPDVVFEQEDIEVYKISSDPKDFKNHFEDF